MYIDSISRYSGFGCVYSYPGQHVLRILRSKFYGMQKGVVGWGEFRQRGNQRGRVAYGRDECGGVQHVGRSPKRVYMCICMYILKGQAILEDIL